MEIKELKLKDIIPYENNPRNNDEAIEPVSNSIKTFGFKVPIVIDTNNVIIAGHTRYKAANKLGLEKVPCIVANDLTKEQVNAFRLADNKVGEVATWDFNALELELSEIENIDMEDFNFEIDSIEDNFNTDFELSNEDKSELEQITFTLHHEQAELIRYSISKIEDFTETFGNTNKNGNAIYELVKQWVELKIL